MAIEEKYDQVRQLIIMGKERGYLLYDEVNDILPAEVHSSDEIDDLLSTFERHGIDVFEDAPSKAVRGEEAAESLDSPELESKDDESSGEELDLSPGNLEKTNDPVRMYLREMGTVPLLTREGEVAIAKRIERGQLLVLKVISRSPLVWKELLGIGEDLREGRRSVKEIVQFDDEELTDEKVEAKTRETLRSIDRIAKLYLEILKQAQKFDKSPRPRKRAWTRAKWRVSRGRIAPSKLIRPIDFNLLDKQGVPQRVAPTGRSSAVMADRIRAAA